jgi:hypothetical protein
MGQLTSNEKEATGENLKPKSLQELQRIIKQDYDVVLNDEEAEKFGLSLLKITRLAMTAFNRAEDKHAITITNTS